MRTLSSKESRSAGRTALLFILETVTTVGYGNLLPFSNELTILFAIIVMITGILLIFMIIPLLLVPYLSAIFLSAPPKNSLMNFIIMW